MLKEKTKTRMSKPNKAKEKKITKHKINMLKEILKAKTEN